MAEVTPGTISKGTPAPASAWASSPPPAGDEGIASLEADDLEALPGEIDEERVDLALGHRVVSRGLAREYEAAALGAEGEDFGGDQPVVDDRLRPAQKPRRAEGDEPGVAGACAGDGDPPGW